MNQTLIGLGAVALLAVGAVATPAFACAPSPADFKKMLYEAGASDADFQRVHWDDYHQPAIVGLWKFAFIANSDPHNAKMWAPGDTVDAGYTTWHADGTELMNSGRPPASGNFCMGVWKQIGPSTFKLNHIALAWEVPTGATYVGPAHITETVTVSRNELSFAGSFKLVQYLEDGKTEAFQVAGKVEGSRVTIDTVP